MLGEMEDLGGEKKWSRSWFPRMSHLGCQSWRDGRRKVRVDEAARWKLSPK